MDKRKLPKYVETGRKKSNGLAKAIIITIAILLLILAMALVYLGIIYSKLGQLSYEKEVVASVDVPMEDEDEEIEDIPDNAPTFVAPTATVYASPTPTLMPEISEEVTNILVLGCDTRQQGVYSDARSDVNIILTIDKKNGAVKITSLMRDILVYYPEKDDYQRLNYALRFYDDPQRVVETVERSFGIEIDNYMVTDFWGMASLIDIFGGVSVYATSAEIENVNDILWNLNEIYGAKDLRQDFYLGETGNVVLTGRQAVAYMRVRKVGADYERVERQYEVLNSLKENIKTMNFFEINKVIQQLPDLLVTDMTQMEILNTVGTLYKLRESQMEQARVPFDGQYKPATYKKMWILDVDFAANNKLLHEFIYE